MDSNTNESFDHHSNSGLLRFRSAPSSLLDCGVQKANSESERLFSRFADHGTTNHHAGESEPSLEFRDLDDKSAVAMSASLRKYAASGLPPHYPRQGLSSGVENGSFGMVTSMAMENHHHHHHHQSQAKSLGSGLVRQSSSPAGLFSHVSVSNGYAAIKGSANFGGLDGSQGELSPSANRLKTQISFSPRLPSSLGMLSQISEDGTESLVAGSLEEDKLGNGNGDARFYGSGFPFGSWNDSSNFTDNFGGLRRDQESNRKLCSSFQNEELGNRIHVLSHHLSLPKNSGEVAMEKFLHFQDSVPCKVRAKRGCATHPRSIAERVRRTRISERMRKLQDLVPNMDKQTNTADMLDLAVDYIKDLQKQYKTLSDNRANCKCPSIQKPIQNQVV